MSSPQMANYLALDRPGSDAAQAVPLGRVLRQVPRLPPLTHRPHLPVGCSDHSTRIAPRLLALKVFQNTGFEALFPAAVCVDTCLAAAGSVSAPDSFHAGQGAGDTLALRPFFSLCGSLSPTFLLGPFWARALPATGPPPHTALAALTACPSAHTAFLHPHVPPQSEPCAGARGTPPLGSIVCHLSPSIRSGRTAHSCGLAVKS